MNDATVPSRACAVRRSRPEKCSLFATIVSRWETLVQDASAAAIAAVLDQVGARLKRIRTQRGMTLTGVAEATGISKSTMSLLETGQRRPTLELLLALSHAYRVPLDDLVGAPPEGDPRLRLKPGRVKGRTVIPLTRQAGGVQA
jgi:DNA-binding XRE family transcriptional regulator